MLNVFVYTINCIKIVNAIQRGFRLSKTEMTISIKNVRQVATHGLLW